MTTTTPADIRLILHVGPGLEYYTRCTAQAVALTNLASMLRNSAKHLSTAARSTELAIPELMTTSSRAALTVMERFRPLASEPGAVLSVASFCHDAINEVLNAVVEFELGNLLLVCLHSQADSPDFTKHQMDNDGFLLDWPYGILSPQLDENAMHALNYQALKKLQPA